MEQAPQHSAMNCLVTLACYWFLILTVIFLHCMICLCLYLINNLIGKDWAGGSRRSVPEGVRSHCDRATRARRRNESNVYQLSMLHTAHTLSLVLRRVSFFILQDVIIPASTWFFYHIRVILGLAEECCNKI